MSTDSQPPKRPLPERPNLRHLKDQAKDLLHSGSAATLADAQFQIARLYGFASWPKLKAHIDSLEETGQLKHATRRCTGPHWATVRMGLSHGSPNAACPGSHRRLRDSPWRNG
jgi:hypothetical protein